MSASADRIRQTCDSVRDMLLEKNAAYGDSVSNPLRIFSKADKLEAIRVRIDDKLSRISRGGEYPGDNDVRDLVGYLLLYLANDGTGPPISQPKDLMWDGSGGLWMRYQGVLHYMILTSNGRWHPATGYGDWSDVRSAFGPLEPADPDAGK